MYHLYYGSGYMKIVGRLAEDSMNDAVGEVKALPDYSVNGEVTINMTHKNCVIIISCASGSLLTLATILQQMPTIPLYHVCPEGMCYF